MGCDHSHPGGTSWPVPTGDMRAGRSGTGSGAEDRSLDCHCGVGETRVSACCPHYGRHPAAVLPGAGRKRAFPFLPFRASPQTPAGRTALNGREAGHCHRPRGQWEQPRRQAASPPQVLCPSCSLPLPQWSLPLKPGVEEVIGHQRTGREYLSFTQAGGAGAARDGFL